MYGWIERWKMDGKQPEWKELFHACAEAGLDAVEIDADSEKLQLANFYGLKVSASYIGLPLHDPFQSLDIDNVVLPLAERLARAEGSDLLVNADPISWKNPIPKTEDQFKRQGENISRLAELVSPMGLKICLHNHASDYHNATGDLQSVIKYAEPQVGLCVDTGWAYVAGCDPAQWVRAYPDRVFAFHLRNQNGDIPTEDLLEGEIDLKALLSCPEISGYNGWMALELWHPQQTKPVRSMTEDVQRSLNFLKRLL
jgi:sugar phosphate isomerase/epimerase